MKYLDLQKSIALSFFSYADVCKLFPSAPPSEIKTQLARFIEKKYIQRLIRGFYAFAERTYDEYSITRLIQPSSYISLESALHYYGIIPDVPGSVTSVGIGVREKVYKIQGVTYTFSPIKKSLIYGFVSRGDRKKGYYALARAEKALLDYIYIRKIRSLSDMRIDVSSIDKDVYYRYGADYPLWIQKIQI